MRDIRSVYTRSGIEWEGVRKIIGWPEPQMISVGVGRGVGLTIGSHGDHEACAARVTVIVCVCVDAYSCTAGYEAAH